LTQFDKDAIENSFTSEFASRGLELVKENGDANFKKILNSQVSTESLRIRYNISVHLWNMKALTIDPKNRSIKMNEI
jgi:hypothetical protein